MRKMKPMKNKLSSILLLMGLSIVPLTVWAQTEYSANEGWVVGVNKERFNNRPVYLPKQSTFILTGDNPLLRYISDRYLYGTLYFVYECNGVEKPFHEFTEIKSMYKGGWMKWLLSDKEFPGLAVELELIPALDSFMGSALKISLNGRKKGDRLVAVYGEKKDYGKRLTWAFDAMGHPDILKWGIRKDFTKDGQLELSSSEVQYLKVAMTDERGLKITDNEKSCYRNACKKNDSFLSRMKINTPDKELNAAAIASLKAVDGSWAAPVFLHGCMQWNNRYPGWRTVFGGTMYGWHDRVQQEAKFYIDSQIKESDKTKPVADKEYKLTKQHSSSLYYGKGRIGKDQSFYNMQTQLFDQLVEEYRWNNSPEYVALLRPALELHLKWQEDCFDPDGDGLYESYINSWPTDSQWYNGGGTAEETSYAYRGHLAALDMALAAGDSASVEHHKSMLKRIRDGFQKRLWVKDKGYSGAYKEQGGYERVHEDPWLYSIFLPVDAGLTSDIQNIESMYYTEWALQNDKVANEGRIVWTSNWLPGVWSVRELWPGDNYHLAYAYMKSGLSEDGWNIFKGTMLEKAFNHTVPGNLGGQQGGTDFGDCIHPFARTLVSGLFGYMPDYPKGKVTFEPCFPQGWEYASIELPDFSLDFRDENNEAKYKLTLAKSASMVVNIPLTCSEVKQVLVNGKNVDYELKPMPGRTAVVVKTAKMTKADIVVKYEKCHDVAKIVDMECEVNSDAKIESDGIITAILDPQGIIASYNLDGSHADVTFNANTGYHTVVARVLIGTVPQYQVFHIKLNDKNQERHDDMMNMVNTGLDKMKWNTVSISASFNADVRTIYKQEYLSPRPNTVSVRLGTDGYSAWTYPHWRSKVPEISLDKVETMLKDSMLYVPQGVPFEWNSFEKNISFVSLWDNFPNEMEFSVNKAGKAACFLVCGSTNMMQCNIANAEIHIIYEDGYKDVLELIPPVNYWNLCPIQPRPNAAGQKCRAYYDAEEDRFCMPEVLPRTVELGKNCTAMVLPRKLREGVKIEKIVLRCMSQEVVVGLMGVSISD